MIGFQWKKNLRIFYGLRLPKNIQKPQKISMYVTHTSHLKISFPSILNYLKNLKTILRNSRLLDQFFLWVISTLEQANTQTKSLRRAAFNTIITTDQSEFSLCALQRHSFDNELNNHPKQVFKIFRDACRSNDYEW